MAFSDLFIIFTIFLDIWQTDRWTHFIHRAHQNSCFLYNSISLRNYQLCEGLAQPLKDLKCRAHILDLFPRNWPNSLHCLLSKWLSQSVSLDYANIYIYIYICKISRAHQKGSKVSQPPAGPRSRGPESLPNLLVSINVPIYPSYNSWLSGEVGRFWRYCNARPTRDKAGASSWTSSPCKNQFNIEGGTWPPYQILSW